MGEGHVDEVVETPGRGKELDGVFDLAVSLLTG